MYVCMYVCMWLSIIKTVFIFTLYIYWQIWHVTKKKSSSMV